MGPCDAGKEVRNLWKDCCAKFIMSLRGFKWGKGKWEIIIVFEDYIPCPVSYLIKTTENLHELKQYKAINSDKTS